MAIRPNSDGSMSYVDNTGREIRLPPEASVYMPQGSLPQLPQVPDAPPPAVPEPPPPPEGSPMDMQPLPVELGGSPNPRPMVAPPTPVAPLAPLPPELGGAPVEPPAPPPSAVNPSPHGKVRIIFDEQ